VLLNLCGWSGGLTAPDRFDVVGVIVGQFERRGALLGDIREFAQRRPDA
jgi:hypothetical protein